MYSKIQQRSEGGIGRKADLDQAEGRLSFARTNLMADQANLRDAETNYLRLVGIPAIELVQPDYPTAGFPETQRSAIALAVNNNPELRAAVSDVAVTKAENRAAKAAYYPRVDFEANYGNNFNLDGSRGRNDEWWGMLRARWNLFNGGADRARVTETAWRTREAKEVRNRTHRQVEESVRLAWSSYITAKEQTPYFRQYVYSTERTRDAYQKQFEIGQRTLLDLLDSENELYLARRSLAGSKNQQMLGQFRVLTSTGSLLDYLGIPLPKGAQQREPKFLAGPWGKD